MEIDSTPLSRVAAEIISSGQTQTNYGWDAVVHLPTETLAPLMTIGVNVLRNYVGAFTDEMTCTLLFPLGKYARRIYPNRNALQITLTKLPIVEGTASYDVNATLQTERYSAVLLDKGPSVAEGRGIETNDEDALDVTQLVEVHFQLFNKAVEQLRLITVGGVFRKTKVDQLLLAMLTKETMTVNVNDQRAIEGVEMVPVSNVMVKEQIIITHGTKLVDLVDYLQKRVGVYSAGLGSYIQNKHWFIYPLYDTSQFQDRGASVTMVVLPSRKYTDIERTYTKTGDSLTILVTGESGFRDDSGTQYLNEGNGARFADASVLMEQSTTTENNRTVMARGVNNNEFITDSRTDGLNHVPVPSQRITANPFPIYSDLNGRNGGLFKAVWQNSDSQLLLPGMVARIIYSDQGEVHEMFGVVHQCQHISHKTGDFGSRKFSNQTIVCVFVNKTVK